ncbi:Semaphorin-2A [Lamellibrachia satsuma]|nr:Semaphorin-2A [Lamellibrachia satsuma]
MCLSRGATCLSRGATCLSRRATCLSRDATCLNLKSFQDPSSGYYRHLVIDSQASALYVGAMEYVFRLDATNIQQQYAKSQKLTPVSGEEAACMRKGKNREFDCKNHIRSIIVHPDKVSVCGTGAYQPRTFSLQKEHLEILQAGRRGSGIAQCPFDPNDNSTYIYIQNGNPDDIPAVYSATVTDFAKSDPMIFRPKLRKDDGTQYDLLRTLPQDRKWLNEANFVGSFDMDEYVYFFFRETAVEYMNCGKAVYARVARVCKIDKGGRSVLEKKWTTYVKARLNCSLPGDYPFYFNELHDVYRNGGLFLRSIYNTSEWAVWLGCLCLQPRTD